MAAIGGHRIVLINQTRVESQGWPARLALLGARARTRAAVRARRRKRGRLHSGCAKASPMAGLRVMETLDRAECGRPGARRWRGCAARIGPRS